MQQILDLYKKWCGLTPSNVELLPKAGSNRHYIRLTNPQIGSVIGVKSNNIEENRCFIYLSKVFSSINFPMPCIYASNEECNCYLQTDLGHQSLYDALKQGRERGGIYNEPEIQLISKIIKILPHIQIEGAKVIDENELLSPKIFDAQAAMFELNYFKYCFLRTTDLFFDEVKLQKDMQQFATDLTTHNSGVPTNYAEQPIKTFLYRDFQARNIILSDSDKEPFFIDFQGGQIGPMQYDLTSFLWQASARYPQTLRETMITEYLDELHDICYFNEEDFRSKLHLFVLFRILQVLGTYGLRGYFERKTYFLNSIPPAIQNLRRQLLDGVCSQYSYLEDTLQRLVNLPQFQTDSSLS